MKTLVFAIPLIAVLVTGLAYVPFASGQFGGGGVDHPGTWYVGEGLKHGDYFEYELCHVDYQDCAEFEMHLWIEDTITVGT